MEEIGWIRRGEVVGGLEYIQLGFKLNSEYDQRPVELLREWGDVVK